MYQGYTQNPYGGRQNGQMMQNYYPQQNMISGRMVTCKEEALGVQVDFQQGITVMPDLSHNRIYVKVLNNQGAADLHTFALVQEAEKPQFVTVEQFEQLKTQLQEQLEEMKGAKK